jgi:biotin carboxyl carrier protein
MDAGAMFVLGTDGYGRSEARETLRDFFEVDARHIAYTALCGMAREKRIKPAVVTKARKALEHRSRQAQSAVQLAGILFNRDQPEENPMLKDVKIPEISENVTSGSIVEVLVKVGDTVAVDDVLVEMETEKAVVEIPSPYAGQISEVLVEAGDEKNVGDVIVRIETDKGDAGEKDEGRGPGTGSRRR